MRAEHLSFFRARIFYLADITGDFITDVIPEFIQSCFGLPVTLELLSLGIKQYSKIQNYSIMLLLCYSPPYTKHINTCNTIVYNIYFIFCIGK
jgi:hypothetical protein